MLKRSELLGRRHRGDQKLSTKQLVTNAAASMQGALQSSCFKGTKGGDLRLAPPSRGRQNFMATERRGLENNL
jgi:hypothetical protein